MGSTGVGVWWPTYIVVHEGRSLGQEERRQGFLDGRGLGAVRGPFEARTRVDGPGVLNEVDPPHPVPELNGRVRVRLVLGVPREASRQVEKARVRRGYENVSLAKSQVRASGERTALPLPPMVRRIDSPAHTTVALILALKIKPSLLLIVHTPRDREPRRPLRLRQLILGSEHGRQAPDALVLIRDAGRAQIVRQEVPVVPLRDDGLGYGVVVARVVGQMPVVNVRGHEVAALRVVVALIVEAAGDVDAAIVERVDVARKDVGGSEDVDAIADVHLRRDQGRKQRNKESGHLHPLGTSGKR